MAEETTAMNEDFSDAQAVEIIGYEGSESEQKVGQLSKKIVALEEEKKELVHATRLLNDEIEKLKESVKRTGLEKEELKREIEKLELEKRSLNAVAARAAELESEVWRLRQDLISAMSDVQELNNEASEWKAKAEVLKSGKKAKLVEMDAVKKERDLLIGKLASSEAKVLEKEEQIRDLERRIDEKKVLERGLAEARAVEKELLVKIKFLEGKLKEAEGKQSAYDGTSNGKPDVLGGVDNASEVIEGRKRSPVIGGLKLDFPLVSVSTVGAVGVVGLLCYLHAAKKQ